MKTRLKMNPLSAGLVAAMAMTSGMALAGPEHGFPDRARVIASTPIYEQVNEPRRECWTERVSAEERVYRNRNNTGGAMIGAILGGLAGSGVGKGDGKVAAAAVGAATGAVIGDRWNDRDGYYTTTRSRPVEQCRMVDNFRQVMVGYDVTYRYLGKTFTTRLPYDPGNWLDVDVRVRVADAPPRGPRGADPRDDEWRY